MLDREIINKMDTDELRNYLYFLQKYTELVKETNSLIKASEETLICLLRRQEDLSVLTVRENKQIDRLARFTDEMEHKYRPACPSYVCEYKTFKEEREGENEQ